MAEIGSVLDNIYQIVRVVGKGGMGAVYMATDTRLNKQWAVKEVVKIPNDEKSELCVKGLRREAELMKVFDHPRIPRIVSILDNEQELQVIMDFMTGQSLDRVLQERGAMPSSIAAQIGIQMCEALSYLHGKHNIIYRDMKPSNIMLTNPDELPTDFKAFNELNVKEQREKARSLTAMLFDFGIASEEGKVSGYTLGYKPPEKPSETDYRGDIYSLGATMFHLVTGHHPREGMESVTMYEADVGMRISTGLERVILKCISEDPNDRYASCDELKRDLEDYTNFDEDVIRKLRRRERLFMLSLIMAVVCLIGAFVVKEIQSSTTDASYNRYIDEAENRNNDISTREQYYILAEECDPGKIDSYMGLIGLYKEKKSEDDEDATFTTDEATTLTKVIRPNLDVIREESVESYIDLCYEVGRLYWFYYSYGDSSDQTILRVTEALPWFEKVQDVCVDEGISYENSKAVDLFCEIGRFYDEHDAKVFEAEDAGTYMAFWMALEEFVDYLSAGDDMERTQWESYKFIVYALESFMAKFKSDGVEGNEVYDLIERVRSDTGGLEATSERTQTLRDYVLERLDSSGSIERAYNANFG